METQMTLKREPAELLEFSLAVQESLRTQLGDSLVDSARSILEMQRNLLINPPETTTHGRLTEATEKALLHLLAEIVLADGVACAVEDEAASTYILDHLAVNERDGERLLRLYEEAKNSGHAEPWEFAELEQEDREAIFDACCKVAWADHQLQPEEEKVLHGTAGRLQLEAAYAGGRITAYGEALQKALIVQQVYTHVEVAHPAPAIAADTRSIQLLAIFHLSQKKGAKISANDPIWCSVLGETDPTNLERALRSCTQLTESTSGFVLKAGLDEAAKRQLLSSRNEATLLRLLLGNGAPLTSRFLSFRMNPPKAFPEAELVRLAQSSPALIRYGVGSGKWIGARAWGPHGAAQLVKEDWSLIKRDCKKLGKAAPFSELEWEAIAAYAREQGMKHPLDP